MAAAKEINDCYSIPSGNAVYTTTATTTTPWGAAAIKTGAASGTLRR
jgi:hypothetical protein